MSEAGRLLVVEDSAPDRAFLEGLLEGAGYEVLKATDGEKAVALAHDEGPDLILLDLVGHGDEALLVCRRLRDDPLTRSIPILIVTSRKNSDFLVAGLESGADDFVGKPIDADELLARVRVVLRSKGLQEGLREVGSFYLDLFSRMAKAVTSPFRLDEDLARILSHALEAVGARRGRLLMFDKHRNRMQVRAAAGERTADALEVGSEVPEGPPPPGVLRLPLVGSGEPLGALDIDRQGLPPLSAERGKLLEALAAQAVMFVENVRLTRDVRRMFLDIIVSLAGAVDAKDAYTHGHTVRVARVSLLLAREAGLSAAGRESLLLAAILHDVGKIGIPDAVLKKPGRLDPNELRVMRQHPVLGAQMLRHIRALQDALPDIRHHHEHWDGTGYPDGLEADAIPLGARIILVADAFDAMTSDRVYRKGMPIPVAIERMGEWAGRQFDPEQFASLRRLCEAGMIQDEDCRARPDLLDLLRTGI
jgi:putative nucleotidyltransferase with HDIG domain